MQREAESCMFWAWSLGGLTLFLHGFSVKVDTIYSTRAGLLSWVSRSSQMIWKEKKCTGNYEIVYHINPREKNKLHINLPVRCARFCVVFFKDKSLLIKRWDLNGFLLDDGRRERERRRQLQFWMLLCLPAGVEFLWDQRCQMVKTHSVSARQR